MQWVHDHFPTFAGWITAAAAIITLLGRAVANYIGLHRRVDLLRQEFDTHLKWSDQRNQVLESNKEAIGTIMLSLSTIETLRQEDLKQRQQLDEERKERHRELMTEMAEIKSQGARFIARLLELDR